MVNDPLVAEYDLRDLIRAQEEATRWEDAAAELAGYYRFRYSAMAAAFVATGAAGESVSPSASLWLTQVLREAPQALYSLRSPFEDYLEVPHELDTLIDSFAPPINEGLRSTRNAMLDLLIHVTAAVWGINPNTRITGTDLMVQGFDPSQPEPELMDFM